MMVLLAVAVCGADGVGLWQGLVAAWRGVSWSSRAEGSGGGDGFCRGGFW